MTVGSVMKRKIAQRADIRELILDAVGLLLARHGYQKMTMEDVARTVGIGKGTIYLHFPGKEELVLSHIDAVVDDVVRKLNDIAGSPDAPETKIKKMLLVRVLHRFDAARSYAGSVNELLASVRAGLLARRRIHFELETGVFAEALKEGKRLRIFQFKQTAERVAWTLIACTNAFLPYSLSAGELGNREEVEDHVSRIADLLLSGLLSRTEPSLGDRQRRGK